MRSTLCCSLLLLLLAAPMPLGADADSVDAALGETGELWFVELPSRPTADGGSLAATRRDKRAFRAAARKAGLAYTERYAFDTLWNGLSIRLETSELAKLTRIPGVKSLYPVDELTLEPEPGDGTDLFSALAMTGADIAQNSLGLTGAGVRVAVMDSGIDYHHPDLGGCFGPGCRVETGWDFVGDAYIGPSGPPPVPDPDPDDCDGHGTHVAGIVGAAGAVTGVAPGVTFGAYKVFGCAGSTQADIMIAAMERALADGMDVLNMSIGSSRQWPQYPTAAASDRAVNAGMVVVASFGNSGSLGLYSGSAPAVGDKTIGVASYNNTHITLPAFEVDGQPIGYDPMSFTPDPPTAGTWEIVFVGRACDADLPLLDDPAGRIALIVRGACSFREKALNAIAAGAVAVVVHNNNPGIFFGTVGSPPLATPVVSIALQDGLFIRGLAPVDLTWTDQVAPSPVAGGGLISSFSSYGLTPELGLKPDLGAPGGLIYSTIPVELGGYAIFSGTSMSSPHVAGAAALVLEAHPHTPAQVMDDVLQNSADPTVWWGNPGLGFLDNVHRQGAGMVDIDDAILATTKIEPGELTLGEGEWGPITRTLLVENNAAAAVTYDLSHVPALSTGGVIPPSFWLSDATVAFSSPSITVPAGGTATVEVTVTPASLPTFGQYGGYIVFTPQGGGQVYRVPYAGFVGDYQGITILQPTSNGFPWLAKLVGGSFVNQPGGATYTMTAGDIPYFLVHLDHQPRTLRMEVFDAHTGKAWHRALEFDYFPRNSSTTSFFAFSWDGFTVNGKKVNEVPDGDYVMELSVQKALGDDDDPAHWESWTSPTITISRP